MPSFFVVERERENEWRKKKEGKKDKRKGKAPLGFNTAQQGGYLFFEALKRTEGEEKNVAEVTHPQSSQGRGMVRRRREFSGSQDLTRYPSPPPLHPLFMPSSPPSTSPPFLRPLSLLSPPPSPPHPHYHALPHPPPPHHPHHAPTLVPSLSPLSPPPDPTPSHHPHPHCLPTLTLTSSSLSHAPHALSIRQTWIPPRELP